MTAPRHGLSGTTYDRSVVVLSVLTGIGFVMIGLGWRGVARTRYVDLQLPALASGCVAGLVLVMLGSGLLVALHARRLQAQRRARLDEAIDAANRVLSAMDAAGERGR